jgi:hypothetical protein
VKVAYPPPQRSSIYNLPVHHKLCFVSEGWYYGERNSRVETPVVTFAKGTTHRQLESLTQKEAEKLVELLPELLKEFEAVEAMTPELEKIDRESQHITTFDSS